jgi:hypothetical protein
MAAAAGERRDGFMEGAVVRGDTSAAKRIPIEEGEEMSGEEVLPEAFLD